MACVGKGNLGRAEGKGMAGVRQGYGRGMAGVRQG